MARMLLFNKPLGVLSQFTDRGSPTVRAASSDFIAVIRQRRLIPGSWPNITIRAKRNRHVRRIAQGRFKEIASAASDRQGIG